MKKLSTLIAIALVLVIGGVYAGWTYFQGGATGAQSSRNLDMATVSYNGEKGSITADTTSLTILVDDMSTVNASKYAPYQAGIHGAGVINVTFTSKVGADADVTENGIRMKATVSITGTQTTYNYSGKDYKILAVNKENNTFELKGGVVTDEATISADDILKTLIFCGDDLSTEDVIEDFVKLPTLADNTNFKTAMSTYSINIEITEIIA